MTYGERHQKAERDYQRAMVLRDLVAELCESSGARDDASNNAVSAMDALVADLNEYAADCEAAIKPRKTA